MTSRSSSSPQGGLHRTRTPAKASISTCRRLPTGWGAAAATLIPLNDVIRTHVFAAERIHADDTTVPVLAKNKIRTGRLWLMDLCAR